MKVRPFGLLTAAMLLGSPSVWASAHSPAVSQSVQVHKIASPQRLSAWLRQNPPVKHPLSLVWTTPEAVIEQRNAQIELLGTLAEQEQQGHLSPAAAAQLQAWLNALPATGRVRLPAVDASWLEANLPRDPMLAAGDSLRVHARPSIVRVLSDDPRSCELPHQSGLRAHDYVKACFEDALAHAWLIQPDGRMQRVGLDSWNQRLENEPAPGAWIWVPRNSKLPEDFHKRWAQWLAWQGPSHATPRDTLAPMTLRPAPEVIATSLLDVSGRGLEPEPTSSDWGNVGLLQTPTARMRPAGSFGVHMHRVWPYRQISVMLQPMPWIETGFRYVSIENRLYGPREFSGDQDYKDKSIDLKLRLLEESRHLPELAIGWRDLGGTGLFSGEYLVASKRWGRLDASLGLGWGYLGNRAMFQNPLSRVGGDTFNTRVIDVGQGGTFAGKSWFHGTTSLFGGLEYQSPWNVDLKIEYDPGNYRREPQGNAFEVASPINWGMVYKPSRGVELSLGVNRGNRLTFGWTLHTDLSGLNMPKVTNPPLPRPRADHERTPPNWSQMARDIERHTQWQVEQILDGQDRVTVQASKSMTPAPNDRLDKALAVMNTHLPQRYQFLSVEHQFAGETLAAEGADRKQWIQQKTQPARSTSVEPATYLIQEPRPASGEATLPGKGFQASLRPGMDFIQTIGGPDGFVLYQLSLALHGSVKLSSGTEVKGMVRQRLLNNYDKFKNGGSSDLPRVRTHLREYFVTSETTLSSLSVSQSVRASDNLYLAVYGGLFEEMFGGVGAEALYRWPGSPFAVGLDMNRVQQRDFKQDLRFRDYKVNTGHLTGYWTTPWDGIHTSVSIGQYLAGDRGATVSVAKTFANGATMGAFATKTNVPAEVFGEGSFDKGIFWSIPFDAFLTSSSRSYANFGWKPLTRDGGAMVGRPVSLYNDTQWLGSNPRRQRPATPPNDRVAPDDRLEEHERRR